MFDGRSRDRCRLYLAVGGDQLHDRAERLASEFARDSIGAASVGIDDSQQPYRFSLLFQFLVDPGMISSKDAHAHYRDGDRILGRQESFSMAGCRKDCKCKRNKEHLGEWSEAEQE